MELEQPYVILQELKRLLLLAHYDASYTKYQHKEKSTIAT